MSSLSNTVSLLCAGACLASCLDTAPPESTGEVQQEQIMVNQFLLETILVNSLIGTPQSLQNLITNPLRTSSFEQKNDPGDLGLQLVDDYSKAFMHYLVGCALSENDPPVKWTHPDPPHQQHQWNGRLGLCSEWANGAPSAECLELVSACLLARENAEGLNVATSQRGAMPSGSAIPLSATVPVHTQDESGQPIDSFQPCENAQIGDDRSCGFVPAASLVGACEPKEQVTLSCTPGSAASVVRVCDGHRGCEPLDSTTMASESLFCTDVPTASFTCPSSGSYAVMVGAQLSSDPLAMGIQASLGSYPATEAQVFDIREGAFYGTLLWPAARTRLVKSYVDPVTHDVVRDVLASTMSPVPVSAAMWACADYDWTLPDAYLLHRLCTVIIDDEGQYIHLCAAQPVGVCNEAIVDAPANICAAVDGAPVAGDGDFDECEDLGGNPWHRPITVYLDHPCDVVPEFSTTSVCSRKLPPPPQ